jgi:hypothetical protein
MDLEKHFYHTKLVNTVLPPTKEMNDFFKNINQEIKDFLKKNKC